MYCSRRKGNNGKSKAREEEVLAKLNEGSILPRCRLDGRRWSDLRPVFLVGVAAAGWSASRLRTFGKPSSPATAITGRVYREEATRKRARARSSPLGRGVSSKGYAEGVEKIKRGIRNRRFLCLPRNALFLPSGRARVALFNFSHANPLEAGWRETPLVPRSKLSWQCCLLGFAASCRSSTICPMSAGMRA